MNEIDKNYVNEEGTEEKIVATSNDNYRVNIGNNVKIANHKEDSKLVKKFKSSLLGYDVGIKSKGFSSIAALATVLVVAVLLVLYFIWRF